MRRGLVKFRKIGTHFHQLEDGFIAMYIPHRWRYFHPDYKHKVVCTLEDCKHMYIIYENPIYYGME